MSLALTALSILSFRIIGPSEMASLRQYYFIPFMLSLAMSSATDNYLRSLVFGGGSLKSNIPEARSLLYVYSIGTALLLAASLAILIVDTGQVPILTIFALACSVATFSLKGVVGVCLEHERRYTASITLNNVAAAIPYFSILVIYLAKDTAAFFLLVSALNILYAALLLVAIAPRIDRREFAAWFTASPFFVFSFRKYVELSIVSVGVVVIYQGVEFALYTHTRYGGAEVANYALAFTVAAMLRQLVMALVQPLQRENAYNAELSLWGFRIPQVAAIEALIIAGLFATCLLLPAIFRIAFPQYVTASGMIAPLVFGVLGSACLQIQSVRLIAISKVKILAVSQLIVAAASILTVLLFNHMLPLKHVAIILSAILWIRGAVVVPLFAEAHGLNTPPALWLIRLTGSAGLLTIAFL